VRKRRSRFAKGAESSSSCSPSTANRFSKARASPSLDLTENADPALAPIGERRRRSPNRPSPVPPKVGRIDWGGVRFWVNFRPNLRLRRCPFFSPVLLHELTTLFVLNNALGWPACFQNYRRLSGNRSLPKRLAKASAAGVEWRGAMNAPRRACALQAIGDECMG
jgi:hypothetical protein